MQVSCPSCSWKGKAAERSVDREVFCPKCKNKMMVRGCGESPSVRNVFSESENADLELDYALMSQAHELDHLIVDKRPTQKRHSFRWQWIVPVFCLTGIVFSFFAYNVAIVPGEVPRVVAKAPDLLAKEAIEIPLKEARLIAPPSIAPGVVSGKFYGGNGAIEMHIQTKNTTAIAIESVVYSIEVRQENRTVPLSEKFATVRIPGGIEPGETKSIQASVWASVFPDEPGEKTGRWLRVGLVSYVPFGRDKIDVSNAVSCRCKYFDAYGEPQNSVGESDNSPSATNPLEALIRKLDADAK